MGLMTKLRNLLRKLFSKKTAKISLTHKVTINLYKIHTLKGDTYWISEDETNRKLGPKISHAIHGAALNPDIKTTTILPWHQIDWLQEAGTIEVDQ